MDEFTPDHATLLFKELTKEKKITRKSGPIIIRPKPTTVNFFVSVVKAFFNYEVLRDHIQRSPMLHIKNLKVEKRSSMLLKTDAKRLDDLRSSEIECREYDKVMKDYADKQIEIDLDDGVKVNYAKFEDIVTEI